MFMCGFIPDKEDSMLGEIVIEEDYLNQIKEDRLIKMLTCEVKIIFVLMEKRLLRRMKGG
jgi:hypothetical protein